MNLIFKFSCIFLLFHVFAAINLNGQINGAQINYAKITPEKKKVEDMEISNYVANIQDALGSGQIWENIHLEIGGKALTYHLNENQESAVLSYYAQTPGTYKYKAWGKSHHEDGDYTSKGSGEIYIGEGVNTFILYGNFDKVNKVIEIYLSK